MEVRTDAESDAWPKFLLFSAILTIVVLLVGPLGYKFELTPLIPSLISVLVSIVGAGLVFLVGLWMVISAIRKNRVHDRNLILIALGLCLIPMIFVVPQILKARSVPPIHDISTDTQSPPEFHAIVALRAGAANDLIYDHEGSAAKAQELQLAAYPDVKTFTTELSVEAATKRAEAVLRDQGLEIVAVDPTAGIVEATATTFWFGFKDDLVVRIRPGEVSSVDVRSVSRVGQSDVGANAARIMKFIEAF